MNVTYLITAKNICTWNSNNTPVKSHTNLLLHYKLKENNILYNLWKPLWNFMKLGHAALIHCGQGVYICVSKLTIFGSDNGLLPGQCQAIICTSGGVWLIRPLWTKFNEILWEIHIFSLTEDWFTMNLHCDDDIFAWFFFHYTGNFYAFIVRTPVDFGEEEIFILKCCVENCIHFFYALIC